MSKAAVLDIETSEPTTVVRMSEGLIGFSEHKSFVFLENPEFAPLRLMESTEEPKAAFVVIDPSILAPGYADLVPAREWETIGVRDRSKRLAFVTVAVGRTPQDSTANMLAPILVNYETMTARQVILPNGIYTAKYPIGS